LAEEIEQLSIAAHQSDPETVELYRAGQVDFNQPTHRHWAKLEWLLARRRTLVGRMIQSGIIPDLVPKSAVHKMRMEVDIAFPQSARKTLLAPGMFVECRLTNKAPVIQAAIMHKEKLKYTIVVSDLDDPDHVTRSYRERCHLLMTNVELSRNEPLVDLSKESVETVLSYIPPHPAEGTKQHRYAVAFYLQPENGTKSVSISEPSISSEDGRIIDSAALATKHELDLVGATYFTTMYDSSVDAV
ncbi:PEBP-like protein, partial [Ramicandelaber brevisporus]